MEAVSRKISYQKREQTVSSIKLAGVILRRKSTSQDLGGGYDPQDYQVLLRYWLVEPYQRHLAVFSGPLIPKEDPAETLLQQCYNWSKRLGDSAGHAELKGIKGIQAVFLSIAGESPEVISADTHTSTSNLSTMFSYVIPVTEQTTKIVDCYPTNSVMYPHFHCLDQVLKTMYARDATIQIHPTTREILSSLDNWLREQHSLPNAILNLFSLTTQQRWRGCVNNPIHTDTHTNQQDATYEQVRQMFEEEPVELFVRNPLFGCDMVFGSKVDAIVVNEFFGKGEPNYYAIGTRVPQWRALPENGSDDWIETYPLHKCALEGDEAGIRRSLLAGHSPNTLDTEGWAPLHYACWYQELRSVRLLVEEGGAHAGIQNETGSTPLHMAAGNGADDIVAFLLGLSNVNPGALDSNGKSPLALCLEYKTNNWEATAERLRVAYKEQVDGVVQSAGGRPRQQRRVMFQPEVEEIDSPVLDAAGSQADITEFTADIKKVTTNIRKIRVNFMNGQHMLAEFTNGRNTQAIDALQGVLQAVNIDSEFQYLLALWVSSKSLSIQLGDTDRPLKLISKWGSMLKKFSNAPLSSHSSELPTLYLRRNVFYPVNREELILDPVALQCLYEDAQKRVNTGEYPCSEEEAVTLAAIVMQLSYGDYNKTLHQPGFLKDKLSHLLPPGIPKKIRRKLEFERRILAKHEDLTLHRYTETKLHHHYLEICRKWSYYGATFYEGAIRNRLQRSLSDVMPSQARRIVGKSVIRIGINTRGFHLIQKDTNEVVYYALDKMEWDMSTEKHEFILRDKSDRSQETVLYTKQAALLHSLATRMKEEMDSLHLAIKNQNYS